MTNEELKPCPFCGDIPEMWSCDRLITITCKKCNYHRAFDGLISNKPSCVPIRYEGGEISSTEFYHPYAHEEAIETWNKREVNADE